MTLRIRWWWWPILAVVLVLIAIASIRMHGWSRYQAVRDDLVARGMKTTPAEWLALAPPVDAGRQARMRNLLEGKGDWREWRCGTIRDLREGWNRPAKGTPTVEQTLADGASTVREAERIMDEGPVVLSWYGWANHDPTVPASTLMNTPVPNLLGTRAIANWWAHSAVTAADPLPYLKRLDQFTDSFNRPGCLIDAMIAVAVASIRDQTYIYLATRHRLDEATASHWIEEPTYLRPLMADAFTGERCIGLMPLAKTPFSRQFDFFPSLGHGQGTLATCAGWLFLNHGFAQALAESARSEAGLRNQALPPSYVGPENAMVGLWGNFDECAIIAYQADYHHRLIRIAGAIALSHQPGSELPADATALAALLPPGTLDTRPDEPDVRYERLGPARFRVGCDPATKAPAGVPSGRINSLIGTPASTNSFEDRYWSLEIDLDAILVPPPAKKPKAPKP